MTRLHVSHFFNASPHNDCRPWFLGFFLTACLRPPPPHTQHTQNKNMSATKSNCPQLWYYSGNTYDSLRETCACLRAMLCCVVALPFHQYHPKPSSASSLLPLSSSHLASVCMWVCVFFSHTHSLSLPLSSARDAVFAHAHVKEKKRVLQRISCPLFPYMVISVAARPSSRRERGACTDRRRRRRRSPFASIFGSESNKNRTEERGSRTGRGGGVEQGGRGRANSGGRRMMAANFLRPPANPLCARPAACRMSAPSAARESFITPSEQ